MRSAASRNRLRLGLLRLASRLPAPALDSRPDRILLLRPDHIGDVLLTAPAIGLMRASLPTAHLTYLVGPWSAEAARHGPPVDEVRTLAYPGFTRRANANLLSPYATLMQVAFRLRRERFGAAMVFRGDHWWGALLAVLAGIPVRVGGATPETTPLLSHTYAAEAEEPAAEQSLGIARLALSVFGVAPVPAEGPQFVVSEAARAEAFAAWHRYGLDVRVVAIHPSPGAPLKSWPVARWAHLADALAADGSTVVLTGAPADARLLSEITLRAGTAVVQLCGQSLDVSAAIYARCALVVGIDSGALHLAAAVGTPTVRLYGPAPPSVFGPWPSGPAQRVLLTDALACAPCGHLDQPPCGARSMPACLLALGVEDVLNTARAQLGQS